MLSSFALNFTANGLSYILLCLLFFGNNDDSYLVESNTGSFLYALIGGIDCFFSSFPCFSYLLEFIQSESSLSSLFFRRNLVDMS
jgi:hypothetical protein